MAQKPVITDTKAKLLPRISLFFLRVPALTIALWLILVGFGIASYTTLMKRAGFPAVSIPVAVVTGTYFVNDPAKVDSNVAKPISDLILKDPRAEVVQARSSDNFFSVAVQYKS